MKDKKELTPEEILMHHRSASAEEQGAEVAVSMNTEQMTGEAANGVDVINRKIGVEQIKKAYVTLQKYKQGKVNLENRVVENEQWYKLKHWDHLKGDRQEVEPASGWLFNCIANKHADAMDNFPAPNILPREESDKAEAEILTAVVPVIFEQNNFEQTYSDAWNYKLKNGTGVYGVFWEKSKLGGIGDVVICEEDLLNLFWEPGITDIQESKNLFCVKLWDNEILESQHPQLRGKLSSKTVEVAKYIYDDTVDTSDKSLVVDWYYKKYNRGKLVLHFCKFVNDVVLYASEDDPACAEDGFYHHGLYPFVYDVLFPIKGSPAGFGYIDIGKSAQEYIDRAGQAIMKNLLANAGPRHFIPDSSGVNEEEFSDLSKDLVHYSTLGDGITPISGKPLNDVYVTVLRDKIDELKETTGNRDISTGGTASGVTAASAIAAMQEAGSKLSRDSNKAAYRAFRKVVLLVIELIRQFYDIPRYFRIIGENGAEKFVEFSNAMIKAQYQGKEMGTDMGYRLPVFDVEVTAQKASPYSRMSQNELALQFYNAGFFNPQLADQALACLDMMDFDRKSATMQKIAQNGGMFQQIISMQRQMLMLAQMVDQDRGTNLADQMAAGIMGTGRVTPVDGVMSKDVAENSEKLGGEGNAEPKNTKKARQRVANSTSV